MAKGTIMPAPWFTGLDDGGYPIVGGRLYTYVAGTSTPATAWTDVDLTVPHQNPIILDGAGRTSVFLSTTQSYKFVLKDADDVTIRTQDNIHGTSLPASDIDILGIAGESLAAGQVAYLSDGSGGLIAGRWYLADADLPYASSLPIIGMAPENISAASTGQIRLLGKVDVSFPLAPGATYWVSTTPGGLSPAPGPNVRVVGVSDTSASIVIDPNPPPQVVGGGPPPYVYTYQIVPVADAVNPQIDCATSAMDGTKMFSLTTGADRVLATPLNPQPGMRMVIAHTASGAARSLSLPASAFRMGSDITAITPTVQDKTDNIGCIYRNGLWDVVGYVKGY